MDRDRRAGILLLLAGAAFLLSAYLTYPRRALGFAAGGLFILAGFLRLARARRR
jgi:hypothetical protein